MSTNATARTEPLNWRTESNRTGCLEKLVEQRCDLFDVRDGSIASPWGMRLLIIPLHRIICLMAAGLYDKGDFLCPEFPSETAVGQRQMCISTSAFHEKCWSCRT